MRYVLIHSPLVGPATWMPVAEELSKSGRAAHVPSLIGVEHAPSPAWRYAVERVTSSLDGVSEALVLIGHSGAGALLPGIGAPLAARLAGYVFVDAVLPPAAGKLSVDASFLEFLRSIAIDGRLPPWSRWWGPGTMPALVPDARLRESIEAELPELPLAYFEDVVPVPAGWDRTPVAYLRFSEAYAEASREAERRGYLVETLPGGHLHAVVDPAGVAGRLVEVAERLAGS